MSQENLSADVVVIGSGVVGSLLAEKLARKGHSVLILEAGPRIDRAETVARFRHSPRKNDYMSPYPSSAWAPHPLYKPEDNGYLEQAGPYPYPAEYIRGVGGTTWHWAAQAWRILPNDFKIKTLYGVGRDWPISYDDLEPYYYEAEVKMGVSGPVDNGSPRSKPFPMEPVTPSFAQQRIHDRLKDAGYNVISNTTARNSRNYDGRPACCGNNNCMPICPIDAQYTGGIAAKAAEKAGVKIIDSAVVYNIEHDANDNITAVHYYTPEKVSHRVTGKIFVVAANGIETPKLLLMSKSDRFPNGIANSSDAVGRYLMDHPSNKLIFDVDEEIWPGRGPMSPFSIQSERDGAFRSERAPFRIDFTNASQVLGSTTDLIKVGVYGKDLKDQIRYRSAHQISIKNVLEQLPDANNRVTLSDKKDAMGIPRPRISYSIDDYVEKGMQVALEIYKDIAKHLGGTNLRFSAPGKYSNNQHITGTVAMGSDPKTSVCDGHGRTHDHKNLFIASTGIMPTVATANSTLTAVAIALRTADAIAEDLA